jgi:uncharacterized Zn-finger protein
MAESEGKIREVSVDLEEKNLEETQNVAEDVKISNQINPEDTGPKAKKLRHCDKCSTTLARSYNLKLHLLTKRHANFGVINYSKKCNNCGKEFSRKYNMQRHVLEVHQKQRMPFKNSKQNGQPEEIQSDGS